MFSLKKRRHWNRNRVLALVGILVLLSLWFLMLTVNQLAMGSPRTTIVSESSLIANNEDTNDAKPKQRVIIVVSGDDYIGNGLASFLRTHLPALTLDVVNQHSHTVEDKILLDASAVVYLGGISSEKLCDEIPWKRVLDENVNDVVSLANRMKPTQLLIFASTAAIGARVRPHNQTGKAFSPTPVFEFDVPLSNTHFSAFTKSMAARETELQSLFRSSTHSNRARSPPTMVGLRLARLIGESFPQTDTTVPHIQFLRDALLHDRIPVVGNPESFESFLSLRDFNRAIENVLGNFLDTASPRSLSSQFRMFYLASFTSTLGQVANEIGAWTGAPTSIEHRSLAQNTERLVDIVVSSNLFRQTFLFHFETTQGFLVRELLAHAPLILVGNERSDQLSSATQSTKSLSREWKCRDHLGNSSSRTICSSHTKSFCPICGSHNVHCALQLTNVANLRHFHPTVQDAVNSERSHTSMSVHRCRRCFHSYRFTNASFSSPTKNREKQVAAQGCPVPNAHPNTDIDDGHHRQILISFAEHVNRNSIQNRVGQTNTFLLNPGCDSLGSSMSSVVARRLEALGWVSSAVTSKSSSILLVHLLEHLTDPVGFLQSLITSRTHPSTSLHVLLPHCSLMTNTSYFDVDTDQFSFFSPSSLQTLAKRLSLHVVRYEFISTTSDSCMVTFVQGSSSYASSDRTSMITNAVQLEQKSGVYQDWYAAQWRSRVISTRDWIHSTLSKLSSSSQRSPSTTKQRSSIIDNVNINKLNIVGFGTSRKGMQLLQQLWEVSSPTIRRQWSFVASDNNSVFRPGEYVGPEGRYCPGTTVPIKRTSALTRDLSSCEDLVVVVLSWEKWEGSLGHALLSRDIRANETCARSSVWVILPFPTPQLLLLKVRTSEVIPTQFSFKKHVKSVQPLVSATSSSTFFAHRSPFDSSREQRVVLVVPFQNEELLLPYFIHHHASMFDHVVLIDLDSTDNSVAVIQQYAPSTWQVVRPQTTNNHSESTIFPQTNRRWTQTLVDEEVVWWENQFRGCWKLSLTVTEFVVHPNFRLFLNELSASSSHAFRMRALQVVGHDADDDVDDNKNDSWIPHVSLLVQRQEYAMFQHEVRDGAYAYLNKYSRFLHRYDRLKGLHRESKKEQGSHFRYEPGRHNLTNAQSETPSTVLPEGFLVKFLFSPWKLLKQRREARRVKPTFAVTGPDVALAHLDSEETRIDYLDNDDLMQSERSEWRSRPLFSFNQFYAQCSNDATRIQMHSEWMDLMVRVGVNDIHFYRNCDDFQQ